MTDVKLTAVYRGKVEQTRILRDIVVPSTLQIPLAGRCGEQLAVLEWSDSEGQHLRVLVSTGEGFGAKEAGA